MSRLRGTYTTYKEKGEYKFKRITVRPRQSLSLQFHHHRVEHLTVVRDQSVVQVGEVEYLTGHGEHRYIPLGEKHRLTNKGEQDLVFIEVQIGGYLGENDIVRLEDIYGRA